MGEIHGKGAIIYLSTTSATAAVPLAEQVDWSIDFEEALVDSTPLNNTWKQFVKGLMGWTGAFTGNFDTTSTALWTASIDAGVQKFYIYPIGAGAVTQYYYGTCWVQLGKVAAGSVTSKASSSFKVTGQGALSFN